MKPEALCERLRQQKHPLNVNNLDSAVLGVIDVLVKTFLNGRSSTVRWPNLFQISDEETMRFVGRRLCDGYFIGRTYLNTLDKVFTYSNDADDLAQNKMRILARCYMADMQSTLQQAGIDDSRLDTVSQWSAIAAEELTGMDPVQAQQAAYDFVIEGVALACIENSVFSSKPPAAVEVSPSGKPIYRHVAQASKSPPQQDEKSLQILEAHYEKHVGEAEFVFHEIIVSDQVHIDVHLIKPAPGRNYWTLATSGMSDRPMTVPPGAEHLRYAELLLNLPPDWPVMDETKSKDELYSWPMRWIKTLARLPHKYNTWLCHGHTIPNGNPPKHYSAHTQLCGMLVINSGLPPDAAHVDCENGKIVRLYSVLPLYAEEMDLKLKEGVEPLMKHLNDAGISLVVDPDRQNAAKLRR